MRPSRLLLLLAALVAVATGAMLIGNDGTSEARRATEESSGARQAAGPVPLVRQVYRNNCETAALSMLLASAAVRVDQRTLQRQLRRSGPLDPIVRTDGSWIWGNPERGFVGRAEGGGTAGGFGVYQRPIQALAARHGVRLVDLSRKPASRLFAELKRGRPVMVWIGLSDGPYRWWQTPAGRRIRVNFGEHTVVLSAIRGDTITVNDPLTGTRLRWTRNAFLAKWRLLGRRALALG